VVEVNDLVTITEKWIDPSTIRFVNEKKRNEWCRLRYPNHNKGCPNYGKSDLCPPRSPIRSDIIGQFMRYVLVHATFKIEEYEERMRSIRPEWSRAQRRSVLYWQRRVKKMIKQYIEGRYHDKDGNPKYDLLLGCGSGLWNSQSMESAGIDVFNIYKQNGIEHEVKPDKIVVLSSLLLFKTELACEDCYPQTDCHSPQECEYWKNQKCECPPPKICEICDGCKDPRKDLYIWEHEPVIDPCEADQITP